jgi:alpha-glucosidase
MAPGAERDWWRGAVIYQIYPRSFCDSNGDGIGDLQGVIQKLDYVASLGVDGIWLSPFFTSPMKDFGYDVSDYCDVDPLFGTLADFDALLEKAHALGLKVIIDQVWSHTSDQHPWFKESAASRDNPKADWYVWADPKPDGAPPNNWQAMFGGPSWTWNPRRRQYYLHNFLVEQPDLNYWNAQVQDAILSAGRFWLDRGVDGFRLDVINFILHDRDLTDNPPAPYRRPPAVLTLYQRHIHDRSQPGALAFLSRLRAMIDERPGRMTVGELGDEDIFARQKEYTAGTDRLHTAYGFQLLDARSATPALFARTMEEWQGESGWPAWSLSNHDVDRYPSRLAGDDPALTRLLLAALLCLRGTAFLYQGDELGLPQGQVPFEKLQDPFAKAVWTGGAFRDGARTPMPWTTEGPSAGFSAGAETWLPLDPAHRPLAAEAQAADPAAMLAFTRGLVAVRRDSPALKWGEAEVVPAPEGVFSLVRVTPEERVLCVFNLSAESARVEAPRGGQVMLSLNEAWVTNDGVLELPAHGGALIRVPT